MALLQATTVSGTLVSLITENTTSSSKTLALDDQGKVVACTNNSPTNITITIPNDSTVNFPVGAVVYVAKIGTGAVTLAAAAGVTATRTGSLGNNEELYLRKRAANNWVTVDQPLNATLTGGTETVAGGYNVHTFTSTGSNTLTIN